MIANSLGDRASIVSQSSETVVPQRPRLATMKERVSFALSWTIPDVDMA